MTILEIIQLIAALAGAAKDIQDIVDDLKKNGHPDGVPVPKEIAEAIRDLLQEHVAPAASNEALWSETHENE
jgi:hypothetical protein